MDEELCCVCYEPNDTLTQCKHNLCSSCAHSLYALGKNICPCCRQDIKEYYNSLGFIKHNPYVHRMPEIIYTSNNVSRISLSNALRHPDLLEGFTFNPLMNCYERYN